MKSHMLSGWAVVALLTSAIPAIAQELTKIDPEQAQQLAQQLSKAAAKIDKPQVKIEADAAGAVGLRYQKDGVIAVPQKGLKESGLPNNANSETGAAFAYLFMSERFGPVIDGGLIADSKLRTVKLTDKQGNERAIKCLLLSIRKAADNDWRLHVYGAEKKALAELKCTAVTTDVSRPLVLRVKDTEGSEGTLNVLMFGKQLAELRIGYSKD